MTLWLVKKDYLKEKVEKTDLQEFTYYSNSRQNNTEL